MNNYRTTFITIQQNAALRISCILQEDDVCIATLYFTFTPKVTYTRENGTKANAGKITADLFDLVISDSVKDKEAIVQRFIQALQMWGDDTNVVSDIEVYLNHQDRYEDVIANEEFNKILYKDACKYYQDEEANETCYLTKHKLLPADLNDMDKYLTYEDSKE